MRAVFQLPADSAQRVDVLGEFNDWTPKPLDRQDGVFTTTIELEAGRRYRFRYLLDGQRWQNDWAADAYVPNEYGGADSLIDLTEPPSREQHAAPAAPLGAPDNAGDAPAPPPRGDRVA